MDNTKRIFLAIFNFIKSVVIYILTHTFPQILIIIVFLFMFQTQLFRHAKFGVFIHGTDNVIYNDSTEVKKKA